MVAKTIQEQLQESYLAMRGFLTEEEKQLASDLKTIFEHTELSEEQINELSKKTLGNYINKAAVDSRDSAANAAGQLNKGFRGEAGKTWAKSEKRVSGIKKATAKLTKEQQEYIESILEALEEEALDNLTLEDFSLDELEDFVLSEDFDQLDEISGELLGRYVQKARADNAARVAHGKELDKNPKVQKLDAKLKDLYSRREYTKSGASKHRPQIDKTHEKIYATKQKLDPNFPKSVSPKRHRGIEKAINKLQYGKFSDGAK